MNTEVGKGREVLLIDRVPQSQLSSDSTVEVTKHIEPVRALRRCRKTEELDRFEVVEQRLVRRRRRMVELVHDDDVEMRWLDVAEVCAAQALDRCENVLEPLGPTPTDPLLTKCRISERVPERGATLVEDLFAVCDEEQPA